MTDVEKYLTDHLQGMAGPYLFVGSGISRRYAGAPSWGELLSEFASRTSHSYGYYQGVADGSMPEIATRIAAEFYDVWWDEDDTEYAASRSAYGNRMKSKDSPLKVEVAKYIRDLVAASSLPADLTDEWKLFGDVVVDGIITTNYDQLLPLRFPGFRTFVGQSELVFSDTQGIAEIYMIHGSDADPQSLVLTTADYESFDSRNAYLAAKLMAVFVEHPVVFLGYSMGDENIRRILQALLRGLTDDHISKLKDRLIFVEWKDGVNPSAAETILQIDDTALPVIRVEVPDFTSVYKALAGRERAIPAKILRVLKEQVFEIVKTNDPGNRLYAYKDIDDENAADFDVVFGVGAKMTVKGIVGLDRIDLIEDVLQSPDHGLPAEKIVERVIPNKARTTYMPCFKYLRAMAALNNDGSVKKRAVDVPQRVRDRAASVHQTMLGHATGGATRTVSQLEDDKGWDWVMNQGLAIRKHTSDLDGLRDFLIRHRDKSNKNWWGTQYAKLAIAYDWMAYAKAVSSAT